MENLIRMFKEVTHILVIVLLLMSCYSKEKKEEKTFKKHKHANEQMHEKPFKELVSNFEDSTRHQWQKPEKVISKFGDLEGKTIADIGAGSGYFSFRLAGKGASVLAIDVDQNFIDYLGKRKAKIEDSLIKPMKVPFDDPMLDSSSIDGALIVNTYHHIDNRLSYFRKVIKALRDGESLIVVDFKKERTAVGPPIEIRLSGLEVMKELQEVGFSKVVIDVNSLPYQYIITAKRANTDTN